MNLNRPIVLYMHAGSGNHGCEAIANSTVKLIASKRKEQGADTKLPVLIVTNSVAEDRKYSLGDLEKEGLCTLVEERHIDRVFVDHVLYYGYRKITGDRESFLRYRFKDAFKLFSQMVKDAPEWDKSQKPLAVSIGGDNYCYPEMVQDLILAHNVFRKKGFETILWGCSIEPDSLKDPVLYKDLCAYSKIYARESITYNGLLNAGISADKLVLRKDPAFMLDTSDVSDGDVVKQGKTIGINLSPMVIEKEKTPGITMENYKKFIQYIFDNTDDSVALIPHVVWSGSDDRKPLTELYEAFKDTGRIALIGDRPAEGLKGYIAKCSFFVGARTHSTIAAYSSNVPTLVIGYSVKSKGIATDLFGTYKNYCLPVQELSEPDSLIKAYNKIKETA
ncbi:MAG: polysaccharide pyruvyl transferase family protein [Butyrivibrio sp.]|jgi:polysaccharide pyruvyl transferase WcaK-like protein|uniref:polysaccharide pyruvyl transferase family protein n=1 Tax=Butyrivibrio sp. TaxID=28121 RepID=UPI001ECD5912|nr:polysaccharide pyruvyl transferase family protein [Butyrivibrio sp.]MBE5839895.1 polysaccharide pyruvyl transferase family protein [Butyrivibrio sp.]